MAVIDPSQQQTSGQAQQPNINAPASASGGGGGGINSALSTAAATGSSAPQSTGQPNTGSKFTNVSSYLNANQGAGQKIANVVGSNLNNTVNNATQNVDQSAQNFQNAVNSENARVAGANNYVTTDSSGNQVFNGDATQVANNAANYSNFQNLYNGTNVGQLSSGLANQGTTAQGAITGAQSTVNNLNSESGIQQLLSQYLGNPNYTSGQQALDQTLFQVGGANQLAGQQKSLNNALNNLSSQQNQFTNSMQGQVASNAQAINDQSTALKNAITNSLTGMQNTATTNATNTNALNAAQNNALNTYFNKAGGYSALDSSTNDSNSINGQSQQQYINNLLQQSGLSNGMQTYNVLNGVGGTTNNPYVNTAATNLTSQDMLSQNQFNQAQALAKLGNTTSGFVNPQTLNVNTGGATLNGTALNTAVGNAQQQLQSAINSFKNPGNAEINSGGSGIGGIAGFDVNLLDNNNSNLNLGNILNDVLTHQSTGLSLAGNPLSQLDPQSLNGVASPTSSHNSLNNASGGVITANYDPGTGKFTGFSNSLIDNAIKFNPNAAPNNPLQALSNELQSLIGQYNLGTDNLGGGTQAISNNESSGAVPLLGPVNRMR